MIAARAFLILVLLSSSALANPLEGRTKQCFEALSESRRQTEVARAERDKAKAELILTASVAAAREEVLRGEPRLPPWAEALIMVGVFALGVGVGAQ